jgi:hypothetical protein
MLTQTAGGKNSTRRREAEKVRLNPLLHKKLETSENEPQTNKEEEN